MKSSLDEAQAGIKNAGRNTKNLRSTEIVKDFMKVKEESEKVGLKLNIQKTKMMAFGPITSWEIDGEKNWNSDRLFSWAPESLRMVTAAMKLKDPLEEKAPWKKIYD